jgi:hypothetical protein
MIQVCRCQGNECKRDAQVRGNQAQGSVTNWIFPIETKQLTASNRSKRFVCMILSKNLHDSICVKQFQKHFWLSTFAGSITALIFKFLFVIKLKSAGRVSVIGGCFDMMRRSLKIVKLIDSQPVSRLFTYINI